MAEGGEGGEQEEFTTDMNETEVKEELRIIFNAVYNYVSTERGDRWRKGVIAKMEATQNIYMYGLGQRGDRPDFSCEETQWAYVYKYFTRHVYVVYAALSAASQKVVFEQLKGNTKWCLCSIGGGPNTDLAGLCLFLKLHKDVLTLPRQVHVLDKYAEWEGTWDTLQTLLPENYRHTSVTYHRVNFQDDITEHETLDLIGNADLVTMVKWLSSVNAYKDETREALKNILGKMKNGAFLLFIDTKCDRKKNALPWEDIFKNAGYEDTHEKIMEDDIHQMETLEMKDIHDDHRAVKEMMVYYPLLRCEDVMMLFKKKEGQPCKGDLNTANTQ